MLFHHTFLKWAAPELKGNQELSCSCLCGPCFCLYYRCCRIQQAAELNPRIWVWVSQSYFSHSDVRKCSGGGFFACCVWVQTVSGVVVLFSCVSMVVSLLTLWLADLNHCSCVSDSCMSDHPVKDVSCAVRRFSLLNPFLFLLSCFTVCIPSVISVLIAVFLVLTDAKHRAESELGPQTRPRSNTLPKSFGSTLDQGAHDAAVEAKGQHPTREETLELIERRVKGKRQEDGWPDDIKVSSWYFWTHSKVLHSNSGVSNCSLVQTTVRNPKSLRFLPIMSKKSRWSQHLRSWNQQTIELVPFYTHA